MPNYTFECLKEHGGCGHQFEQFILISDYDATIVSCPNCLSTITVKRNYQADLPHGYVELKTLGSLAEKNSSELSGAAKEELYQKHNSYKFKTPTTKLPKNMEWMRDKGASEIHKSKPKKHKRYAKKS